MKHELVVLKKEEEKTYYGNKDKIKGGTRQNGHGRK